MAPKHLIVIQKTPNNLSAFSPDMPGCVATGPTKAEVEDRMRDTIQIDGMPNPFGLGYAQRSCVK